MDLRSFSSESSREGPITRLRPVLAAANLSPRPRLAQQRRPYPRRQPCLGLFGALQAIGPLGAPPRVVPRAAERDFASLEGEKDRFVLEQCRVSAECDELNKVMHDQQFT